MNAWILAGLAVFFGWLILFACIWAACASRRLADQSRRRAEFAEREARLWEAATDTFARVATQLWNERDGQQKP